MKRVSLDESDLQLASQKPIQARDNDPNKSSYGNKLIGESGQINIIISKELDTNSQVAKYDMTNPRVSSVPTEDRSDNIGRDQADRESQSSIILKLAPTLQ